MSGKALIAMSGGVDSSLAARLMQEQGYECIGCNMRLYMDCSGFDNEEELPVSERPRKTCCSAKDAEDAKQVAELLGMPFFVLDLSYDFQKQVIDKFVSSYEKGLTPNPCIDCNRYMKFGRLLERAELEGCEKVVTGHYARLEENDGEYYLKKAVDESKDQSYVLYCLPKEILGHLAFPLGELTKAEVRRRAEGHGFVNAHKRESQDICFVPDGNYAEVIKKRTGKDYEPGNFVDRNGNILGRHKGIIHYTIGQRKGLGIAFGEPRYVAKLDMEKNEVVLATDADLFSKTVRVADANWLVARKQGPFRCQAKIRYRQKEQPATVTPEDNDSFTIEFDEPQRAITPGQAAVLYDGDIVLGGGVIQGS
ncbi:MAG: tRNA 2-thiouridine(34) synthase MnmA [Lachnospiraceae bacterium]|nr:tRNA 2-thiouridine(34) synthase MnmA [Lachnospiraceae bacterium]